MSYASYYTIIITFICPILLARIFYLESVLKKKKKAKEYYDTQRQNSEATQNAIEYDLRCAPSKFYTLKSSCMNANEALMYYYLNKSLTALIPNPNERKVYYVFPQVCLYSFVKIRHDLPSMAHNIAQRNYIAKSFDYVICRCHKVYNHYEYTPVLLIELNGQSHYSSIPYGANAFSRQQANDAFKKALTEDLHIPLANFRLENNHLSHKDLPEVHRMLREQLHI